MLTTLEGLVMPKKVYYKADYLEQLNSIPTVENQEPDSIPDGFNYRSDGSLVAPNGLAVSKDGWIATADGFIIDDIMKYDFITLVNSYSEILKNMKGEPCDVGT